MNTIVYHSADPTVATGAAPAKRQHALDSLRGIAAVVVLFHHLYLTVPPQEGTVLYEVLNFYPCRIFTAGRGAVMLFFILSGFALSCSLRRPQTYPLYAMRRICRIYLPFVCAILMGAALCVVLSPAPVAELGSWFNAKFQFTPVTPRIVLRHLLMIGRQQDITLDGPIWSLIQEMRISLVFPLMAFCVHRKPVICALLACVAYPLGMHLLMGMDYLPFLGVKLPERLMVTGYFACFFVIGILMAEHQDVVARAMAWGHPLLRWALAIAALLCLAARSDLLTCLGAVIVIAFALTSERFKRFLMRRPFVEMGRISYSFYLTHILVLFALFETLHGTFGPVVLIPLVIVASLAFATLFYILVEAPAHRLSRKIGRRAAVARDDAGTLGASIPAPQS